MTLPYDLVLKYAEENSKYKDQARQILCNRLGFEPDILKSYKPEIYLRHLLNKIEQGEFLQERLDERIDFCLRVLKKWQEEKWPDPIPKSPQGKPDYFSLKWIREIALDSEGVQRLIKEKNQAIELIDSEPEGHA